MPSSVRSAVVLATSLACVVASAPWLPAAAQPAVKTTLTVDWADPDIRAADARRSPAASIFRGQQAAVDALRIPVLGFVAPPEVARKIMGANAKSTAAPEIVFDAANPVWFHLEQEFGDVTVSIDADLRVDQEAADGFKSLSGPGGRVSAVAPRLDSRVSILEEGNTQGTGGVMASYTIYRFPNIPYQVTIQCTGALQKSCRDTALVVRDQAQLKVIAGKP